MAVTSYEKTKVLIVFFVCLFVCYDNGVLIMWWKHVQKTTFQVYQISSDDWFSTEFRVLQEDTLNQKLTGV